MSSLSVRFPLYTSLLVFVVSLFISMYWAHFTRQQLFQQQLHEIETETLEQASLITIHLSNLFRQVRFFAESEAVRKILYNLQHEDAASVSEWKDTCANDFAAHLRVNHDHFQVRLIGLADGGREVVRVDSIGGKPVRTSESGLQRKADRNYFRETIQLSHGQIYYSTIDLNIERGKVVIPYQPTVRAATPIFYDDGKLYGILVINMNASRLLKNFKNTLSADGRSAYLLNRNESFLVHPDPARRFGFELGQPFSLQQQFTDLADAIARWRTKATPMKPGHFQSDDQLLTAIRIPLDTDHPEHTLLGISSAPKDKINAIVAESLRTNLLITFVLVMLSIGIAVLFSRRMTRPLARLIDASTRIGEGRDLASALPTGLDNEIGTLSRAFVDMHDKLQQREAALLESREKISAVLNSVVNAVITINGHGIIESVNPAAESMFGYKASDMVGQNVSMLMPSPHRDNHDAYLHNYFETGENRIIGIGRELSAMDAGGNEFPIYLSVSEVALSEGRLFTGVIVDQRDQKVMEATLRTSEQLARIMESTQDLFISLDHNFVITYANRRTETVFQLTREAIVNHHVRLDEAIPDLGDAIAEALRRCDETREEMDLEVQLQTSGTWFHVWLYPTGNGVLLQILDITDIKEAEQNLLQYTNKLERANRELSEFAYVASHDLQEPLRKIQAFTDRLNKRLTDEQDEKTIDYLQRINAAAKRMSKLIEDLLLLSRLDSQARPYEEIDLARVAGEVLSDLESTIDLHDGRVEVKMQGSIFADPSQIRALLQNLIGNALKFHVPGQQPVVKVSGAPDDTQNRYVILVEDNGIGIVEEHRQRIFAPFARLHSRDVFEGTGIGLAVCKKVVDRHGGSINVEGSKLGGCRFVVNLPITQSNGDEEQ